MSEIREKPVKVQTQSYIDNRPVDPEGQRANRPSKLKWIIFLLIIIYMLLSYFHAPILNRLGGYLIVRNPVKKSDLIVCFMGEPIERGLEAAELFKKGLAPHIFFAREKLPDGQDVLHERGIRYPETRDMLKKLFQDLGVPEAALITSDGFVRNTFEEAGEIRELARRKGYHSLIVVTSPFHTRRVWLVLKKVLEEDGVEIIMAPSHYSNFSPDGWWKNEKYIKSVVYEYQKLLYYLAKHL
ncbi:MAG: YdcF family protein [Desulfobacterales bacterium]|nr:YdcF family protein [Desulfobacterales bacterium]